MSSSGAGAVASSLDPEGVSREEDKGEPFVVGEREAEMRRKRPGVVRLKMFRRRKGWCM